MGYAKKLRAWVAPYQAPPAVKVKVVTSICRPAVMLVLASCMSPPPPVAVTLCETLGALGGVTPNPRAEWKTHADNLAVAIRARGEG